MPSGTVRGNWRGSNGDRGGIPRSKLLTILKDNVHANRSQRVLVIFCVKKRRNLSNLSDCDRAIDVV